MKTPIYNDEINYIINRQCYVQEKIIAFLYLQEDLLQMAKADPNLLQSVLVTLQELTGIMYGLLDINKV